MSHACSPCSAKCRDEDLADPGSDDALQPALARLMEDVVSPEQSSDSDLACLVTAPFGAAVGQVAAVG